jgi:hypothetical protein
MVRHDPIIADEEEPIGQVPYEPASPRYSPEPAAFIYHEDEAIEVSEEELAREEAEAEAANQAEEDELLDAEDLEPYPRSASPSEASVQVDEEATAAHQRQVLEEAVAATAVTIQTYIREDMRKKGHNSEDIEKVLEEQLDALLEDLYKRLSNS